MRKVIGAHAQHREIGVGIVADEIGGEFAAIGEKDAEFFGAVNDVAVGEQITVR